MKALLIWNNLWADRRVCFLHPLLGTSDTPVLRAENCFPVSYQLWSAAPLLLLIIIISNLSLHSLTVLYSSRLSFSFLDSPLSVFSFLRSNVSIVFCFFYQFFSTVFITSNSLSPFLILLPSHLISISPTLLLFFTLSLQWGHSMNNSKALQDDNGKLEVRLCVACVCVCVCVRLVDSFGPGGNSKGFFIHIN